MMFLFMPPEKSGQEWVLIIIMNISFVDYFTGKNKPFLQTVFG